MVDRLTLLGRGDDEWGVGQEEELALHMLGGLLKARAARGVGVVEVELVQYDEAGLLLLHDELRDLAVHGGDARGEVDDEHAQVGTTDGFFRSHRGENLDRGVALCTRPEAGGIDEGEIFPGEGVGEIDRITGGPGDVRDNCALILEDGVDEGGLSGVGLANDGELDAGRFGDFGNCLDFGGERGEDPVHFFGEETEIPAVLCGDGDAISKSKTSEVAIDALVLVVIDLVEDEPDGRLGLAELLAEGLVDRAEAFLAIDDEEDQVGRFHGDVRLDLDLGAESVVEGCADATCVDDRAGVVRQRAGRGNAVAGDARLVVDDGDASSGEAVEDGGFPDVRASDDGDSRHGGGLAIRQQTSTPDARTS